MITLIERQIKNLSSHRTSRLLEACKKIQQFGKAMSPFFNITDIFVSSHPDWAAIAWGAIRLVFQVWILTLVTNQANDKLAEYQFCWFL
jgi:hypothetical protein